MNVCIYGGTCVYMGVDMSVYIVWTLIWISVLICIWIWMLICVWVYEHEYMCDYECVHDC